MKSTSVHPIMPEVTQFQAITVGPEEDTPQWTPHKFNGEDPSIESTWPHQALSDLSLETTSNTSQTTANLPSPKLPTPMPSLFTCPVDSHLQTLTFATPKNTYQESKASSEDFKYLALSGLMGAEIRYKSSHCQLTSWSQLISMSLLSTDTQTHPRCWLVFQLQMSSACKYWHLQWQTQKLWLSTITLIFTSTKMYTHAFWTAFTHWQERRQLTTRFTSILLWASMEPISITSNLKFQLWDWVISRLIMETKSLVSCRHSLLLWAVKRKPQGVSDIQT